MDAVRAAKNAFAPGAQQIAFGIKHGNRMLTGDYKPGFFVRLFQKDLRLAVEANMATGVTMPVTSIVTQFVNALCSAGGGELDCAAAAEVWFALSEGKPIKTK